MLRIIINRFSCSDFLFLSSGWIVYYTIETFKDLILDKPTDRNKLRQLNKSSFNLLPGLTRSSGYSRRTDLTWAAAKFCQAAFQVLLTTTHLLLTAHTHQHKFLMPHSLGEYVQKY